MLKRVRFSNFKMFKNETIIDLVPSKSEILKKYNVQNNLLRGGLFYGSNASGKTTALNAISILLDMLFKEFVFSEHLVCFFSESNVANFEYVFDIDENEIIYSFSVKKDGSIVEESLVLNETELLKRVGNQAITKLIINKEDQSVDSKLLYLRVINFNNGFSNFPILAKLIKFLSNSLYINIYNDCNVIAFNQETYRDSNLISYLDKNGPNEINQFFEKFDIPFRLNYQKINVLGNNFFDVSFINMKTNCKVPLQFESYGNKLLVQLLPFILKIKETGGMMLIDEFGGGLHNKLTELLINYLFKQTSNNQIFVVTHETNLLKTNIVRPDQVFIVDYNEDGSFISKASNHSPRESQNLEKMYLAGVFGGIPLYGETE